MNTNAVMAKRDLDVIWHPCTQMKDHEHLPMIPIHKAEGVYLEDFEGNRYIDVISSWWVNLFGHCNATLNRALTKQMNQLEHVILAGFTHEAVIELSERLVAATPERLTHCFYADNGSSAVEVALKMSYHYYRNRGQKRSLFLSLENSYHGETIGALSVGDVTLYKKIYEPILIQAIQTPVPKDMTQHAANEAAMALEDLLKERAHEIAAFIVEPLIQGAGGMHMYHPLYLQEARRLCDQYDVLLIADEVMVGFGRTGKLFACEHAGISPDLMTLSKGLTGGYLPLSVTMLSETIYQEFYCDYSAEHSFLHSHSYTGNALACAVANATLDIFEQEQIIEKNQRLSEKMREHLKVFETLPHIKNIRVMGMVAAFDIDGYSAEDRVGLKIYQYGLRHGVLLRPLGHVIYFMPPYIITDEELQTVFNVAFDAVKMLLD